MYSLDDGNQSELIYYATVDRAWLERIKAKYDWKSFHRYDNRLFEYIDRFVDPLYQLPEWGTGDHEKGWQKLNRSQKMLWAFIAFDAQVNNGGVYQFLFNYPEYTLVVADLWVAWDVPPLAFDYNGSVLDEFLDVWDRYVETKKVFNNSELSDKDRWDAFVTGYDDLPSGEVIEEYYYDDEFKAFLYKRVADFVERNIDHFAQINGPQP